MKLASGLILALWLAVLVGCTLGCPFRVEISSENGRTQVNVITSSSAAEATGNAALTEANADLINPTAAAIGSPSVGLVFNSRQKHMLAKLIQNESKTSVDDETMNAILRAIETVSQMGTLTLSSRPPTQQPVATLKAEPATTAEPTSANTEPITATTTTTVPTTTTSTEPPITAAPRTTTLPPIAEPTTVAVPTTAWFPEIQSTTSTPNDPVSSTVIVTTANSADLPTTAQPQVTSEPSAPVVTTSTSWWHRMWWNN